MHIQRIFDKTHDVTLLVDEAHELPDRLREMLSGRVDGGAVRRLRAETGRTLGRRHPLYKAMTSLLNAITDLPVPEDRPEGRLTELPQSLRRSVQQVTDAIQELPGDALPGQNSDDSLSGVLHDLLSFGRAMRSDCEQAFLYEGQRDRTVHALALDVGSYFA